MTYFLKAYNSFIIFVVITWLQFPTNMVLVIPKDNNNSVLYACLQKELQTKECYIYIKNEQ